MTRVVLAGGSGLVGRALVERLSARGDIRLTLLLRKALDGVAPAADQIVGDPDMWIAAMATAQPHICVSTLGTTMRKAGSQRGFRAVDHDLVVALAQAAHAAGARQMISVSSVGATADSGNFYLRTKAEAEAALAALNFARLDILRPALLIGARVEARLAEGVGQWIAPVFNLLLPGPLRRYRSIDAATVARAIAALIGAQGDGRFVHHHDEIEALANG